MTYKEAREKQDLLFATYPYLPVKMWQNNKGEWILSIEENLVTSQNVDSYLYLQETKSWG